MAFHPDSIFCILRTIISAKSIILQKSKKKAYNICCLFLVHCPTHLVTVCNADWFLVTHPCQLVCVTSSSGAARAAPAPPRAWLGGVWGLVPGLRRNVILMSLPLPGARDTKKPPCYHGPAVECGHRSHSHTSEGAPWAQALWVTHLNCLLLNHLLLLVLFWVLKLDWAICIFLGIYFRDRYYLTFPLSFGTSLSSQRESVAGQKSIAYSLTTMH